MNETKTKTIVFAVLAVFVVIAAGFLAVDSFSKVQKSSREYLNQKKELKALQQEKKQLKEVSNEKVKNMRSSLESLFSNPERPLEDILFLENTAKENDLAINTSVGVKENKNNPWPYFYLDVNLTGELSNILSFISSIKSRKWINSIESLKITQKEEETSSLIKLKVYYLEDNKDANTESK